MTRTLNPTTQPLQTRRKVALGLSTMIVLVSLAVCSIGTASAQNPNCTLILPDNVTTAAGLSTPFLLYAPDAGTNGPCNEGNAAQGAFAQAVIYDPGSHQISVYNPLVINLGTSPAIAPTPAPPLPPGAVVALWFGFDGNNLTLQMSSNTVLTGGTNNCVNGNGPGNLFGHFAYCNAVNFFAAVNSDATLSASIPSLGTSPNDSKPCPSVRDFSVVDQDQSDNLPTEYLMKTSDGLFAQNTAANRAAFGPGNFTVIANLGDERLVPKLLDPALGCSPWLRPDLADPGSNVPSLAANELQSARFPALTVALVPANDPMAETGGSADFTKVNLYRAGVGQPQDATIANADPVAYCRNIRQLHPSKLLLDKPFLVLAASPVPSQANSLFTFMALRYVVSYQILGCDVLLSQPVNLVLTIQDGVVTNARSTGR